MLMQFTPEFLSLLSFLCLPLLYAETHYRFRYFISRLNKTEPEIIADCPSRLKKGDSLPILLIIKDAHLYPVFIEKIELYSSSRLLFHRKIERDIRSAYEEILSECPTAGWSEGALMADIRIVYRIHGYTKICRNDNHRGGSHAPLPVYISAGTLPRYDDCVYGEVHAHTLYTSDQVEFGASLSAAARLAEAMELDFFCATDHSYDLDDREDNYLLNDPSLPKWRRFWQEVEEFNKKNQFQIIPGEEVTVRNERQRNVHCLVYNSRQFFPGSGDGAEKWLRTRSELSIDDLLKNLPAGACAFAAHPAEKPPFLQWLLLKRGHWQKEDSDHEQLHGLQFINDSGIKVDKRGQQLWIELLLAGQRKIGLAGNDAHGNFARFRQIGIPFLTIDECYMHLFGRWRTGVYLPEKKRNATDIIIAMRNGSCFMTNGPALLLQAKDQSDWQHTGSQLEHISKIRFAARSSREFSTLESLKIYCGYHQADKECLIFQYDPGQNQYSYETEIDFLPEKRNGYIRAEITTHTGKMALSNPIWF